MSYVEVLIPRWVLWVYIIQVLLIPVYLLFTYLPGWMQEGLWWWSGLVLFLLWQSVRQIPRPLTVKKLVNYVNFYGVILWDAWFKGPTEMD